MCSSSATHLRIVSNISRNVEQPLRRRQRSFFSFLSFPKRCSLFCFTILQQLQRLYIICHLTEQQQQPLRFKNYIISAASTTTLHVCSMSSLFFYFSDSPSSNDKESNEAVSITAPASQHQLQHMGCSTYVSVSTINSVCPFS